METKTSTLNLTVNGEPTTIEPGTTLGQLIDSLALGERRYAVELNETVIPRSEHPVRMLEDGDRIEIIRAIGGG